MRLTTLYIIFTLILNSLIIIQGCSPSSPTPKPTIPSKISSRKARPSRIRTTRRTTTTLPPTTTTPPSKIKQTLAKYSKYTRHGFYIEIEESGDNITKIYQMKKLPPIYSQTMNKPFNSSDQYDNKVEQIIGGPPVKSKSENGDLRSREDLEINRDWKGDCFLENWKYCSTLERIIVIGVYNKTDGRSYQTMDLDMDCTVQEITCMANGWTVNRCQIICMSKCNRNMLSGYDAYVQSKGACKYI